MATTDISDQYEFNAPPEVVFGVLTDPDRITRWLPTGVRAESVEGDRVRLKAGSRLLECAMVVEPDELTVRWRSLDITGLRGTARVTDAPAGGSVLHAEVQVPPAIAGEKRSRELLAETMRHLRRDVSDNFNAG